MDRNQLIQRLREMTGQKKLLVAVLGLVLSVGSLTVALKLTHHAGTNEEIEVGEGEEGREAAHHASRTSKSASLPEHVAENSEEPESLEVKSVAADLHEAQDAHPVAQAGAQAKSDAQVKKVDEHTKPVSHEEHLEKSEHGVASKDGKDKDTVKEPALAPGKVAAKRELAKRELAKKAKKQASAESWFSQLVARYANLYYSIQEKVDGLKSLEDENEKLKEENAHLRLAVEAERYERHLDKSMKITQVYEWKLSAETGSKTGRAVASIRYKPPTDLLPTQLFDLGLNYFRTREDERAAIILNLLVGLEGENTFRTPENLMLTGIAWYRLDNYELADYYFEKVLKTVETAATRRLLGQARLWKGLAASRTGQHGKAQSWLSAVRDHDPHSIETAWINNHPTNESEEQASLAPAHEEVQREPAQEHQEH